MERTVEPKPEQLLQWLGEPLEGPIAMINLLRYREQAAYAPDAGVTPCTGREAYGRYSEVAIQKVAGVGGRVVWMGVVQAALIAPEGERWDDAVIVEYPSKEAFLRMISDPEYQACVFHRTAALEDSRLIATRTALSQEAAVTAG